MTLVLKKGLRTLVRKLLPAFALPQSYEACRNGMRLLKKSAAYVRPALRHIVTRLEALYAIGSTPLRIFYPSVNLSVCGKDFFNSLA